MSGEGARVGGSVKGSGLERSSRRKRREKGIEEEKRSRLEKITNSSERVARTPANRAHRRSRFSGGLGRKAMTRLQPDTRFHCVKFVDFV
ncbi:hypothetical protein Ddye_029183 [Dipteronia dyeriana]|uniref:Uncharacterized protein n=1 Tax=Dipteronia dyeriana TaxID=168575 RepID=A0AAD9TEB2_9ROSI|nr:hypothetical protein Ddye_029183 [Dipteronia dyeriana]